jgi:hypothetical protein
MKYPSSIVVASIINCSSSNVLPWKIHFLSLGNQTSYRYTGNEDNWNKYVFGSIVHYEGAYIPRLPLPEKAILKNQKR